MVAQEKDVLVKVAAALQTTVELCMCEVGQVQHSREYNGIIVDKNDSSIQLPIDKLSDKIGKEMLRQELEAEIAEGIVAICGEETGAEGSQNARYEILLDGNDGSRPMTVGALTSTVICACFDRQENKVIQCVVGEPASLTTWRALYGLGAWRKCGDEPREEKPINTWKGDPGKQKNVIFLDTYNGLNGGAVVTDFTLDMIEKSLSGSFGRLMLGSNGMHLVLVANGMKLAAASITTAYGGPWDVAPVLHVLEAGGAASAYLVKKDMIVKEVNPLAIKDYNVLITAASKELLNRIVPVVTSPLGRL